MLFANRSQRKRGITLKDKLADYAGEDYCLLGVNDFVTYHEQSFRAYYQRPFRTSITGVIVHDKMISKLQATGIVLC